MNWNWVRMATLACTCLLTLACDSTGRQYPSSRPVARQVVSPACNSTAAPNFPDGDVIRFEPDCYPPYFFQHDGYFLASTGQPVPRLERTCGAFRILVVFFDTEAHRELLFQNPSIPEPTRAQLRTDLRAGLRSLFSGYGAEQVFGFLPYRPPVSFTYEVSVSSRASSDVVPEEERVGFTDYDAVLFLEDVPGDAAAFSVIRWPANHPIFRTDEPPALRIDPRYLSPGLFYNELFRRNVPVLLSQYAVGPPSIEEVNGIRYERKLIMNPRTLRSLSADDIALLSQVLNGWYDVDQDGITDCEDTDIEARPWNLDADLLPDLLDPNLEEDNGPFFWTRG